MSQSITPSLVDTLILFSVHRRLATKEELYHYQYQTTIPLEEISAVALAVPGVMYQDGMYGFEDEFEHLWKLRQEMDRETIRRYRKIRRYGKVLISIPYIRGIFVAGSLAFSSGNAKQGSDIDIFVVTAPNRIWLGRLGITLMTQFLGIRRRGEYDENLFCLNHFVTEDNLYRGDHDIYSAELYSDYIPVGAESVGTLQKFWETNAWRTDLYPQIRQRRYPLFAGITTWWGKRGIEKVLDISGTAWLLTQWVRFLQKKKITRNPLTRIESARITATDTELEFHPYPNTIRIQERMKQRKHERGL